MLTCLLQCESDNNKNEDSCNIEGGTWTDKSKMITPRWSLTGSVVNNKIYTFGGAVCGYTSKNYALNEVYDPSNNTWSSKTSMPTSRFALTSSVLNNMIYVIAKEGILKTVVDLTKEF